MSRKRTVNASVRWTNLKQHFAAISRSCFRSSKQRSVRKNISKGMQLARYTLLRLSFVDAVIRGNLPCLWYALLAPDTREAPVAL